MDELIQLHYAVNIADLATYGIRGELHPVRLLLVPLLQRERVACEGKRWDGGSVLVRRDIKQARWDAIMTILREGVPGGRFEPVPKFKLRIYESKTGRGSWRRI